MYCIFTHIYRCCPSWWKDFAQFASTAGWAVGGAGARDLEKRKVGYMGLVDKGNSNW